MLSLHDYHAQELAALRQAGYDFAKLTSDHKSTQNPAIDVPWNEQLLQGCAWLTARIKQQFDGYQMNWQEQMLRYVMPDALQPLPAMTIAHWHDPQHRLSETMTVVAGTEVTSAVDSVTVAQVWQTTQTMLLHPLHVSKCQYQGNDPDKPVIELELTLNSQATFDQLICSELVFYLNADLHLARQLYYLLLHPATRVIVCYGTNKQKSFFGNPFCAHWVKPDQQNRDYLSSDAHQWLRWYFCFPQQFLWVRLTQLDELFRANDLYQWHLKIYLPEDCPLASQIDYQTLLMHCVPLINLRQQILDPIRLRPEITNYPLPMNSRQEEMYRVTQVVGYRRQQHEAIEIPLFHCLQPLAEDAICYRITREAMVGKTSEYVLVVDGEEQKTLDYLIVTLSSCANTAIQPVDLFTWKQVGQLTDMFQVKPLVQPSSFQSVIPPAKLLPLLIQCLQHGRFTSDFLHREIQQYAQWVSFTDQQKLTAMKTIQLKSFHQLCQGMIRQGNELYIELDEHAFVDRAEVFLWGSVFNQFCQSIHPMDRLLTSKWMLLPSQQTLIWTSDDA
ncbi:MAG: hypothetical protein GKR77_02655 [Legionellales bacterium]|nr:hypothetical protein [Legionellales bacterium]